MDYLYNDEIIMRNHDAQLARESEARGISIGRNETEQKYQESERQYIAQPKALKAENARLKTQLQS